MFITFHPISDTFVDIRPIFLIQGPEGSGKSNLVQIAAQRMGLNLTSVDFSEIQSLASAQTEAKLRIVLRNAKSCVPCILLLSNIQVKVLNVGVRGRILNSRLRRSSVRTPRAKKMSEPYRRLLRS